MQGVGTSAMLLQGVRHNYSVPCAKTCQARQESTCVCVCVVVCVCVAGKIYLEAGKPSPWRWRDLSPTDTPMAEARAITFSRPDSQHIKVTLRPVNGPCFLHHMTITFTSFQK